jgi:hypothetical protein
MGGKFKKIQNLQKKKPLAVALYTQAHTGTRARGCVAGPCGWRRPWSRLSRSRCVVAGPRRVRVCAGAHLLIRSGRAWRVCALAWDRKTLCHSSTAAPRRSWRQQHRQRRALPATRPFRRSMMPSAPYVGHAPTIFFSFFFWWALHDRSLASTLHRHTRRGCWPPRAMTILWRFGSSTWHGSIAYVSLVCVPTGATDLSLYRCRCAAGLTAPWPTWFCASSATLSTTSATKSPPSCCASTLSASVRPHVRLPTNAD